MDASYVSIMYTVYLGYNDTSFHTIGIVTNRISVRQEGASMFSAKIHVKKVVA